MRNVYILDEHQSSRNNGIGTYVEELINCFVETDYRVTKISFNADLQELGICTHERYVNIMLPQFDRGNFQDNSESVSTILGLNIADSRENIFFVNHSPCCNLLESLREIFPQSVFIFVIHDMCWTASLMGCSDKIQLSNIEFRKDAN